MPPARGVIYSGFRAATFPCGVFAGPGFQSDGATVELPPFGVINEVGDSRSCWADGGAARLGGGGVFMPTPGSCHCGTAPPPVSNNNNNPSPGRRVRWHHDVATV